MVFGFSFFGLRASLFDLIWPLAIAFLLLRFLLSYSIPHVIQARGWNTLQRFRRDGWTPARQLAFLETLARTRSIAAAARAAGMSRESAYRLRTRDPQGLFAAAWDRTLKGHKPLALRPRPKRRQAVGLGWNSIKGHELHDALFSTGSRRNCDPR